jgi:hypothetical protein
MYRVEWVDAALKELAADWERADSGLRLAITRAAHEIDSVLADNPRGEGESRPNGRRILHIPPIGLFYRLEADGQTVTVLQIWVYRTRRPL